MVDRKMSPEDVNKLAADVLETSDDVKALGCCVEGCSCSGFAPSVLNPAKCRRPSCKHTIDDHGC